MRTILITLALTGLTLAACGGGADTEPTATPTLQPAGEARGNEAVALGTRVELNNGLALTVQRATLSAGQALVTMVVENRGTQPNFAPDMVIRCADGQEGAWVAYTGPDALERAEIPVNSQDEGVRAYAIPAGCSAPTFEARASGAVVGEVIVGRWKLG